MVPNLSVSIRRLTKVSADDSSSSSKKKTRWAAQDEPSSKFGRMSGGGGTSASAAADDRKSTKRVLWADQEPEVPEQAPTTPGGDVSPLLPPKVLPEAPREPLRVEGLVVSKRLTSAEATRYLVIDFNTGALSVYKKPPPKYEPQSKVLKRTLVSSRVLSRASNQNISKAVSSRSKDLVKSSSFGSSDEDDPENENSSGKADDMTHVCREERKFARGVIWRPEFTELDWKIR